MIFAAGLFLILAWPAGMAVLLVAAGLPDFPTYTDRALLEFATLEATEGARLLGAYSRFGFHFPGPALFYWYAPFYWLSGSSAAALFLGQCLLACAALAGVAWSLRRDAGLLILFALALHLSLRACAQANLASSVEYLILGVGPERAALESLAQELGIGERVKFLGALPRAETLQQLANGYALIHPSLHDSGGLVCLEAMAAGRPVICLDTGGPATQVTEETGIKVPVHHPQQVVEALADAMATLANNPSLCGRMSRAGQRHVRDHFSWETKGKQLAQLYVDLASQS